MSKNVSINNAVVSVPSSIWKDVHDFFAALVDPCKCCVRGNPIQCWHGDCAAFPYRIIARDVLSVNSSPCDAQVLQQHVLIENEILDALSRVKEPVLPSDLKLWVTNSKVAKSKAITRLVKRGKIIEKRIDDHTRYISLPKTNKKGLVK
jgi:hypothetical protein